MAAKGVFGYKGSTTRRREINNRRFAAIHANKDPVDNRPPFRGFLAGDYFITSRNARGIQIDTNWVNHVLDAIDTDDVELCNIAFRSVLADPEVTVTGGTIGAPYAIADIGFYTQEQFDAQMQQLIQAEHDNADPALFVSDYGWELVDKYAKTTANHNQARFEKVRVGDTLVALAVRKNAYLVATNILSRGVNPLQPNDDDEDIYAIIVKMILQLNKELKEIQAVEEEFTQRVMLGSEAQALVERETKCRHALLNLDEFIGKLTDYYGSNGRELERLEWEKTRLEYRREVSNNGMYAVFP
jgi:hypothetical protein